MAKRKPISQQVVIVTGATSGIGLATARMLADAGAAVVLVARGEADLREVCAGIAAAGGRASYVVADVASREAVQAAADHAVAVHGGFDTFVNIAGLTIYGALKDVSEADNRRLMETNFWGVVHGSLIAAKHFRERGGGTIINVGSVASDLAFTQQGMYVASKHAVKGFTDALRMELIEEGVPITVTLLKPNSIDSPLPNRARNYMDREPMLPPPIYRPEEVAYAVKVCAEHAHRELVVGGGGVPLIVFRRLLPGLYDRIGPLITFFEQRGVAARNPQGALHAPQRSAAVHGEQPGYVMRTSLYTRAILHPRATAATVAALGALAWLARGQGSSRDGRS